MAWDGSFCGFLLNIKVDYTTETKLSVLAKNIDAIFEGLIFFSKHIGIRNAIKGLFIGAEVELNSYKSNGIILQ